LQRAGDEGIAAMEAMVAELEQRCLEHEVVLCRAALLIARLAGVPEDEVSEERDRLRMRLEAAGRHDPL
jgi:hypothetical protein